MGKKWIYRLKKDAHVAQKLNVVQEDRLDDMRKALSEYYSETENHPHRRHLGRAGSNVNGRGQHSGKPEH